MLKVVEKFTSYKPGDLIAIVKGKKLIGYATVVENLTDTLIVRGSERVLGIIDNCDFVSQVEKALLDLGYKVMNPVRLKDAKLNKENIK